MPSPPKIERPVRPPNAASQASFITRGTSSAQQSGGGGGAPLNPIVGYSRSRAGSPSLLGGV